MSSFPVQVTVLWSGVGVEPVQACLSTILCRVLWAGPDSAGSVTGAPPGPFRPAPFGDSLGSRERAQGSRESLGAGQGSLWRCLGLKPCYRAFKDLWRGEILVHGMLAL